MSQYAEETYDVYHERNVVSRKEHNCCACYEKILKGQYYWRIGVVFDGHAETLKRCLRCQQLHEHLRDLGDQQEWPDERLNCGHGYREMWDRSPPDAVAGLAFKTSEEMQNEYTT